MTMITTRRTAARLPLISATVVAIVLGASGCATQGDAATADPATGANYPLTITNCGNDLTIESEPASILTIGTSALSLLDAAGAADRIVARSGEFGAELPDGLSVDLAEVPILDPSDPTTEKIVGAQADVVVGYGLFNSTDEDLAATGVTNIVIDGECSHDAALTGSTDFDAIFADIERLASVFGTQDVAAENVAGLRAELDGLDADATAGEPQSAAVVYYFSPASTLSARGGQGIANDILARAGLTNVYEAEPSVYLETNVETLLDADPAVIVLAYGLYGEDFETAKALLLSEPGTSDLTAVRNNAVIGVLASDLAPDPDAIRGLRSVIDSTATLSE
ncbi:ABC transporter (iron.B12.siderophore.hemin), periplasmic substrate-binding component [Leifsonia rubra CMS 76R]|nr:ABC transporter (iron.B12.siderophore.hemin), periplasmic substrate-binding component [Leifsonia rubra CMS 76R]